MSEEESGLDWGVNFRPLGANKVKAEGYVMLPKDRGKVTFTLNLDLSEFSTILEVVNEEMKKVIGITEKKASPQ